MLRSPLQLVFALAMACGQNVAPAGPPAQAPPAPGPVTPTAAAPPAANAAGPTAPPPISSAPSIASVGATQRSANDDPCLMRGDKDPCYLGLEASVMGQLPGRARRNGNLLALVLDDGRTVEKTSTRDNEDSTTAYSLLDFRGGFFMVLIRHYEGADWLAISAATGEERSWSRMLVFAPDARHLAVAPEKNAEEGELEALQIWAVTGRGVASEVLRVPTPCAVYRFEWQGPDTIVVKTDAEACGRETTMQVRRGASGQWAVQP